MANERENNTNYTIYENGPLGEVQIANEVVAIIAGIAATEVDGVAAMAEGRSSDQDNSHGFLGQAGTSAEIQDGRRCAG